MKRKKLFNSEIEIEVYSNGVLEPCIEDFHIRLREIIKRELPSAHIRRMSTQMAQHKNEVN